MTHEETRTFQEQADAAGARAVEWMREQLEALRTAKDADDDGAARDDAERDIHETPLSVETRSGWHAPGEAGLDEEFCILLSTGGPASRIIGELSEHGEPESARFEYQDWGTPWTRARMRGADEDVLVEWASQFYFAG